MVLGWCPSPMHYPLATSLVFIDQRAACIDSYISIPLKVFQVFSICAFLRRARKYDAGGIVPRHRIKLFSMFFIYITFGIPTDRPEHMSINCADVFGWRILCFIVISRATHDS